MGRIKEKAPISDLTIDASLLEAWMQILYISSTNQQENLHRFNKSFKYFFD